MGKPAIPPYGKDFRLEQLPYIPDSDMATRRYVSKRDSTSYIRSSKNSELWYVFYRGAYIARHDTLRQALSALRNVLAQMDGE